MPDHETTPTKPGARTISVSHAATLLGISRTTAYECVRSGDLPSVRLGGRIVVPTSALEAMLGEPVAAPA